MRRLLVIGVGALLLAGCGRPVGNESREAVAVRCETPRVAGIARPVVLYPRHVIRSALPVILLAVPLDSGRVLLRVWTDGGLRFSARTRRRTLPWPLNQRPLRAGEKGIVLVECAAGRACGGFEFDPAPVSERPFRGVVAEARTLAARGHPMAALRLLIRTHAVQDAEWAALVRRTGFPLFLIVPVRVVGSLAL